MSSALELQQAIRGILSTDATVTALVPAAHISDRHALTDDKMPAITFGPGMEFDADMTLARHYVRVAADLHVWVKEPGLVAVKQIAGAIRHALAGRIVGFVDVKFASARFLRDPDGQTAHGIVSYGALAWNPE